MKYFYQIFMCLIYLTIWGIYDFFQSHKLQSFNRFNTKNKRLGYTVLILMNKL